MATLAKPLPDFGRDDRFFLMMAVAMALTTVAGFSLQLAMGRSTFNSPPLVHLHAVVFFGWVALFVTQNILVTRGSIRLHRRLGWIGASWAGAMIPIGLYTTVTMVRNGTTPFFFLPGYFLIMNAFAILCFGGLVAAAIQLRKRTEWHRRMMFCAMATLTGPAFGRLLPMPLMIPYAEWGVFAAVMIWPLSAIVADARRRGRVHPALWWGSATIVLAQVAMSLVAQSALGSTLYAAATSGSRGASVAPLVFPPAPTP